MEVFVSREMPPVSEYKKDIFILGLLFVYVLVFPLGQFIFLDFEFNTQPRKSQYCLWIYQFTLHTKSTDYSNMLKITQPSET